MLNAFAWSLFLECGRAEPEAFQVKPKDPLKSYQILQAYQCSAVPPLSQSFHTLHITLSL